MADSPWGTLLGDKGQPLFTGSVGASPFNTGTAPGMMPNFQSSGFLSGMAAAIWQARNKLPFTPPALDRLNTVPSTLAARRKLYGSQGVGSTFLTGPGGVKPGSQTLGYSGLLGQ